VPLYRAIVHHLEQHGRFNHDVDRTLVENYCLTQRQIDQARAAVEDEGLVVVGAQGPKAHPAVAILNQATQALVKLGAALGIGPAARKALSIGIESPGPGRRAGGRNGEGDNPWQ
jgi:P27 family predicted phage terminase small subunit